MSLQVWLPLMEDFHNQGLANVQVTAYNNPTFINGKLGQCCHFDGTSAQYIELISDIFNTLFIGGSQQFSICFWIKNEEEINTTNRAIIFGDYVSSSAHSFNLEIPNVTNGGLRIYWKGSNIYSDNASNYSLDTIDDNWIHIAVVYNGTNITLYKNGQLNKKSYSTVLATQTNKIDSKMRIGRDYRSSISTTAFTGCLNDFRIYDNALSAKEVEEIAKGLILHYKLDDVYNDSTIQNYRTSTSNLDGATSKSLTHTTSTYSAGEQTISLSGNKIYYMSCEYDNTSGTRNIVFQWTTTNASGSMNSYIDDTIHKSNIIIAGEKGLMQVKIDLTDTSLYNGASLKYRWLGSNKNASSSSSYYHLQIVNTNQLTEWIPGGTIRDACSVVYDSSGYQNNGTIIGNLITVTDTPRYNLACFFGDNVFIKKTDLSYADSYWTISCWFKKTSNVTTSYECPVGFTRGNGSDANKKFSIWVKNTTLGCVAEGTSKSSSYDKTLWHHVCLVNNNKSYTYYLDGISIITFTNSNCLTDCTDFVVGGRAAVDDAATIGSQWGGNISDVRFYATALTLSQVQELYNTSALVDNAGNVYARELVEN